MADEDLDLDEGGAAPKSSKKLIIIIAAVVLLLVAAGAGMYFMGFFDDETQATESAQTAKAGDEKTVEEEQPEALAERSYWPLEPPFVLNFEGKSKARYMQIGLEVATTNSKAYEAVKKHLPVIRNEIVLLLSGQKYEEIVTPEGKEQLRAELIETVNKVLKQHKVKKGIDNIYFTSFVMQ